MANSIHMKYDNELDAFNLGITNDRLVSNLCKRSIILISLQTRMQLKGLLIVGGRS